MRAKIVAVQSDLIDHEGLQEGDIVEVLDSEDDWNQHRLWQTGIEESTAEYIKEHCHLVRAINAGPDSQAFIMYKGLLDPIIEFQDGE